MNQAKTLILLGGLSGLLIVIGSVIGGSNGATIALIIAIALNFSSYWFSHKIVLWLFYDSLSNTENIFL